MSSNGSSGSHHTAGCRSWPADRIKEHLNRAAHASWSNYHDAAGPPGSAGRVCGVAEDSRGVYTRLCGVHPATHTTQKQNISAFFFLVFLQSRSHQKWMTRHITRGNVTLHYRQMSLFLVWSRSGQTFSTSCWTVLRWYMLPAARDRFAWSRSAILRSK